jgi:uncharacterized membrane protein
MEPKTKRNLAIWSIIVLVLLNLSSLATIWYHRYQFTKQQRVEQRSRRFDNRYEAMERRIGRIPPFISEAIDLSPKQKEELDSIWRHFNNKRRTLEDSMNQNRRRMFHVMMAAELDTSRYEELSEAQTSLLKQLNYTMLTMNRSIRGNLTDEQQKAMTEKMTEMRRGATRERRHRTRK